jgi:hypothetical protein
MEISEEEDGVATREEDDGFGIWVHQSWELCIYGIGGSPYLN